MDESTETAKRRPICKHCQNPTKAVNRPRGLCWTCYYTPGVKDLYPAAMNQYGRPVSDRRTDAEVEAELDRLIESRRATMPRR